MSSISDDAVQALRARMLAWYDECRRDLPWRERGSGSPDPYRVWLSEVMLQQTRVETVRPYYERWIRRFPDLASLASASLDDVLKEWEGLGYYSRARNLHRAVREVVAVHGSIPADAASFRALPGVGRYTAGAVLSIAFGREEPVVDGNVRRVFARLLDLESPADADLWDLATRLVIGSRPGDLNQAVMELGATICTPRRPACRDCPLSSDCLAYARGVVESRPRARKRAPLPTERVVVAVALRSDGRVLIVRRPRNGRLGGLWEFPALHGDALESSTGGVECLLARLEIPRVRLVEYLGEIEHVFTHVRVFYEAFFVQSDCDDDLARSLLPDPPDSGADRLWVLPERLVDYAMSRAQRRIMALALAAGWVQSPGEGA